MDAPVSVGVRAPRGCPTPLAANPPAGRCLSRTERTARAIRELTLLKAENAYVRKRVAASTTAPVPAAATLILSRTSGLADPAPAASAPRTAPGAAQVHWIT